ncbi:MBL fold metallo-hydrolase [Xanthocytophaga flava]|uniref:MBL fold metallo-hydrolase n=1 Tax=Xanthocytophaga flava TaxID=3048013 RepID=UPI0028D8C5B0|nr:MBL fold metallo-hydrolase [Xanthocytophaga flavus]MDJ1469010.1 MBL fold metallo-hydrolase [Xanthocytophaga flavus]
MMLKQLPPAVTYLVKDNGKVRVHTLVSSAPFFANATHIIELPTQLILIDGHFFAQYGYEFRQLADSLNKPITRFYVTHAHPDHYLGMGDAFADVIVYALEEITKLILQAGPHELKEKQQHFGNLIATHLTYPSQIVEPGEEEIDGVRFIFEKAIDTESPETLVIKLPDLRIAIVQDILYHNSHAFITRPVAGWKAALQELRDDTAYDTILAGHGTPADKADIDNAILYLDKVGEILSHVNDAIEYKQQLLAAYPNYAAAKLIDIYLPILFANKV